MISSRLLLFQFVVLGCALTLLSGCREEDGTNLKPGREERFPSRFDLETDEDGIARLIGETAPFTGSVVHRNKDYRVIYFAHYQDGKKCGPEIRFHENGRIYRVDDHHDGRQIHQREWHDNGNRALDATMQDGVAHGRHLRWHENGKVFWEGAFTEGFKWHGRIQDYSEDGSVVWDAEFDKGRYLGGTYPPAFQKKLLDSGELRPEDAVYSAEEAALALKKHEAEEAARAAENEKRRREREDKK